MSEISQIETMRDQIRILERSADQTDCRHCQKLMKEEVRAKRIELMSLVRSIGHV